jgi:adenine-specific DNA-methyltransferase
VRNAFGERAEVQSQVRELEIVKSPATTQKLRGGYYTPPIIARFLADWAIGTESTTVLEPSCGDGNILEAAVDVLLQRGTAKDAVADLVFGVEIDAEEAQKAMSRLAKRDINISGRMYIGDFFAYCREQLLRQTRYDVILGNPPFIRYQNFQEEHRVVAFRLMEHAGLRPTRLTNVWVPFLVASTLLLNERGGKVAMVIPAELLQVNYTSELRQFLSANYSRITLFTFRKLVFAGIQQEIVLFLGERDGNNRTGIRIIELDGIDDLARYEHTQFSANGLKVMDHSRDKWTQYFLDQDEIDSLRDLRDCKDLTVARDVIDVDVGIVTGLNDFFVLTEQQAARESLEWFTRPIVTRSAHLQGIRFTPDDLAANSAKQHPCFILNAPDVPFESLPETLKQYIAKGEQRGYHRGYKCRIRDRWYVVPSVWAPDAFMLRQVHGYPKIILNETKATCTDTIHRVRFIGSLSSEAVTAAFINSLTFAFAEVMGRSYGGGVLELEPNEAEALPLPLKNAESLHLDLLHRLIVQGHIEDALDITDQKLLIEGLGLDRSQVTKLRDIWHKLRDRRIHRNHRKSAAKA